MNEIRDVNQTDESQPTTPQQAVAQAFGVDSIDELTVSSVVGLENDSERKQHADKLKTIVEWAKQEKYENKEQLAWIVRSLMNKLGSPELGEKWITKLSRYAYLQMETRRLEKEQQELLR